MKNISKSIGLEISEKILTILKKDKRLSKIDIDVGCFTNCREEGLTQKVSPHTKKQSKAFTFCTYEHRNSDQIIINGKEGYITFNGELPYIADSKWEYFGIAGPDEYEKAAKILANLIIKWVNGGVIKSIK